MGELPKMADKPNVRLWGTYRYVYCGYVTGRRINAVSFHAEAWFWRMHAKADDFGNIAGDPETLKAVCAPMRKEATLAKIVKWNEELAKPYDATTPGLVMPYVVDGRPYLHLIDFAERQPSARNGKPVHRVPPPDGSGSIQCNPVHSSAPTHTPIPTLTPIPIPIPIPNHPDLPTSPIDISSPDLPRAGTKPGGSDARWGDVEWSGREEQIPDLLSELGVWAEVIRDIMLWQIPLTVEDLRSTVTIMRREIASGTRKPIKSPGAVLAKRLYQDRGIEMPSVAKCPEDGRGLMEITRRRRGGAA